VLTDRASLDLGSEASIAEALALHGPWAVINAAGYVRVDQAETDAGACYAANAEGAVRLAAACGRRGIAFAGFSSDLVFDGALRRPYVETDAPRPLNVYGLSKARAERRILAQGGQALMVRTAAFFSPYDPHNFAAHLQRVLVAGDIFEAANDLIVSPTYTPDLVDAVLDLVIDGETGLWHLANGGAVSWADFARLIAEALGFDPSAVRGVPSAIFGWPAPRPAGAALASVRGAMMPSLENAVARYAATLRAAEFLAEQEAEIDREVDPLERDSARA
jgi:dTDP-4-dehydrorhamnose reductase